MSTKTPDITLYALGDSRAIRVAWLLEELGLPYKLVTAPRAADGNAPPDFKAKIPTRLGNSPTIQDGDLIIQESSAILEYLCETYDTSGRIVPKEPSVKAAIREWMSAAEGTFLLHAFVILYSGAKMPEAASQYKPELAKNLSGTVTHAFEWLESELASNDSGGKFLVGTDLTAADIMMAFSVDIIFALKLGTERQNWPRTDKWLSGLKQKETHKRAAEKTGYTL